MVRSWSLMISARCAPRCRPALPCFALRNSRALLQAYAWLKHNTDPDAKVASWWDYGYQTTAMANRTIIVDNNTWNNTHIATVGRAMSSPERKARDLPRTAPLDSRLALFS